MTWPASPTGATALLAAAAVVPLWVSGYRNARRPTQRGIRNGLFAAAAIGLLGILAAAAFALTAGLHSTPAQAVSFVYSGAPGDAFSMKIQGVTTEANTHAGSDETTWGWGYVTSIENTSTFGTLWQQNSPLFGNATLAFMIYGIADLSIVPGGNGGIAVCPNVFCPHAMIEPSDINA